MNKKLKLLLSVLCLCLTLGMAGFAVYATTSTTYTLSNTVQYKIEDVYVRIQTKLYKKSTVGLVSETELNAQSASLEGKKHSEITGLTLVETYDEFSTYNGKVVSDPTVTGCNCDIAYNTTETSPAFAYYVVLEIENYASEPIHAILSNKTTADINSYTYFTSEIVNISGKTTTSVVIGFALKDTTIALSSTSAPFELKINTGEYKPEDFMTFTEISNDAGEVASYSVSAKDKNIEGALTIPAVYNKMPVTSIASDAFRGCSELTSVTIPEGVTSVGKNAFINCSKLSSVTIPETVTSIGDYAFYGCSELEELNYNAVSVANFTNLSYHFYNAGRSGNGITVNFGENVESLPSFLFYDSQNYVPKIKEVNFLGNKIQKIGGYAFYCASITSITIPESVTSMSSKAFYNCKKLEEINYNAISLTNLNSQHDNFYCAGQSGEGITVNIGENVKSVPDYLFYENTTNCEPNIASVNFLGNKVTSIGQFAFGSCFKIKTITIPESVTSIAYSAFNRCYALEEINYNAVSVADFVSSNYVFSCAGTSGNGVTVNFGENVNSLPDYLFYQAGVSSYATNITSVNFLGNKVKSIGSYAFGNLTKIKTITIPENVTSIGYAAFNECSGLEEINFNAISINLSSSHSIFYKAGYNGNGVTLNFGENVEHVANYLIQSSSAKITQVNFLGDKVKSIGNYAFQNCASITDFVVPESVISIGNYAFDNCILLENISISDNVTSIGNYAFYRCSALTSVTIPKGVITLGRNLFKDCTALTSVSIVGATADNWGYANFDTATKWNVLDLTNSSTNAGYFTSTYVDKYWKKVA